MKSESSGAKLHIFLILRKHIVLYTAGWLDIIPNDCRQDEQSQCSGYFPVGSVSSLSTPRGFPATHAQPLCLTVS